MLRRGHIIYIYISKCLDYLYHLHMLQDPQVLENEQNMPHSLMSECTVITYDLSNKILFKPNKYKTCMTGNATITNHISTHGTIRKSHKDRDTHIISRIHLYKRNQLSLPQRKDCQLRMDASDYKENRTKPKTETINTRCVYSKTCASTQCLVCLLNALCVYSMPCVSTQCLVCLLNALCVYSMPCLSTHDVCVYAMPCMSTQCLV